MVRSKRATMVKRLQSTNASPNETDNDSDAASATSEPPTQEGPVQPDNNMAMFNQMFQAMMRHQREVVAMITNGNNNGRPQVTVAITTPKPYYADERRDTQEFEEWVTTVNDYARRTGQPPLEVLQGLLEGPAMDAFRSIPLEDRETFEQAIDRIRPMVQPLVTPTLAAVQLLDLKQKPNETATVYMRRYQRLYQKTTLHHIERATWLHGLNPKLREKMIASLAREHDRNTLRQVQETTVTKDQLVRSVNRVANGDESTTATDSDSNETPCHQVKNKKRKLPRIAPKCRTHPQGHHSDEECGQDYCENHKAKGHPTSQCHMYDRCTRCGKDGHTTQQCRIGKDVTCYNCNKSGHIAASCNVKSKINRVSISRRVDRVMGTAAREAFAGRPDMVLEPTQPTLKELNADLFINGTKFDGTVVIDTGADMSVVPRKVVNSLIDSPDEVVPAVTEVYSTLTGLTTIHEGFVPRLEIVDIGYEPNRTNGRWKHCVIGDVDTNELLLSANDASRLGVETTIKTKHNSIDLHFNRQPKGSKNSQSIADARKRGGE